ncbi:unannotated protein [freshwater metagenome]|uniref:Unannotated protein n=1 Tax=freshwater metagenome TaxID=449393 RepID=A0A6J6G288_9ZZZZ
MPTATSSMISMPADYSFANRPTSTATRIAGDAALRSSTGRKRLGSCVHRNIVICSCLKTSRFPGIPNSSNTDDLASGSKETSIGHFHAIAIGELRFQSGVAMPTAMNTASALSPNSANSPHEISLNSIFIARTSTTSPSIATQMAARERCAASLLSSTRGSTPDQCLRLSVITHSKMPILSMVHSQPTSSVKPSTKPVAGFIRSSR